MVAVLVSVGAGALTADAEAFCWFSPRDLGRNVVCLGAREDSPGEWLTFGSIRALSNAGWSIVDLTPDPRFSKDGVRLAVVRLPAPAAYTRSWLIFPPP